MWKINFIALLFLSLFAIPAFAASPAEDCLGQIAQAIDSGDAASFEQLVDLDGLLKASLERFLTEAQKPENAAALPPMLAILISQSGGKAGEAVKKLLTTGARSFVLNGISSGAFAGKKLNSSLGQNLLSPLFAQASIGRKEIRQIGEAMPDGNEWLLPFSIHDYGNDQDYAIIGRFSQASNGAKLTAIENLDQIFNQIQREIAEQNEPQELPRKGSK